MENGKQDHQMFLNCYLVGFKPCTVHHKAMYYIELCSTCTLCPLYILTVCSVKCPVSMTCVILKSKTSYQCICHQYVRATDLVLCFRAQSQTVFSRGTF